MMQRAAGQSCSHTTALLSDCQSQWYQLIISFGGFARDYILYHITIVILTIADLLLALNKDRGKCCGQEKNNAIIGYEESLFAISYIVIIL